MMSSFGSSGGPATPTRSPQQGAVWWVIAGVAIVVIVAMLGWLLLWGMQPTQTPTPTETPTTDPSASSGVPPSPDPEPTPGGVGEFEPTYELRSLATLELPERFQDYDITTQHQGSVTRTADYRHSDNAQSKWFTVDVLTTSQGYASILESMVGPGMIGNAVCGTTTEDGVVKLCVMAGTDGTLRVGSAAQDMTTDDLAGIIQDFYAL